MENEMTAICIERYEAEQGDLPHMCMCCGAPATVRNKQIFCTGVDWIMTILGAVMIRHDISDMTNRVAVWTSFCERHGSYWAKRRLLLGGSLAGAVFLPFGGLIFLSINQMGGADLLNLLWLVSVGLFIGWIILAVNIYRHTIRATEVTITSIKLTGVCKEYMQAVEENRSAKAATNLRSVQ
ncbi:MAG TPA: hypothetical protein VGX70_04865 [Gemmataceae bacterium]|jgi:hypothetical protein|nr:hypothetical protein [Gemmataceae bacterium]